MIIHDSKRYRIEETNVGTGLNFALDRKEPARNGGIGLNNLGWFRTRDEAFQAMNEDDKGREIRVDTLHPGQRFESIDGQHWRYQRMGDNDLMIWAENVATGRLDCFARCALVVLE